MKKAKKVVLNAAAKVVLGVAKMSCGAASWFDFYQPKEPAALKKMK